MQSKVCFYSSGKQGLPPSFSVGGGSVCETIIVDWVYTLIPLVVILLKEPFCICHAALQQK